MCDCTKEYRGPTQKATANKEFDRICVRFLSKSAAVATKAINAHLLGKAEREAANDKIKTANAALLKLADQACPDDEAKWLTRYLETDAGKVTIRKYVEEDTDWDVDWEGFFTAVCKELGARNAQQLRRKFTTSRVVPAQEPRVQVVKPA